MYYDINEQIGYQVQRTAEWRRSKAEQFPDNPGNVRAAEELERLAAQIERLARSETHKQICEVQDRLVRTSGGDGDVWADIDTTVSHELRSIGFHNSYETGVQFLEWYRDLLEKKLQDWVDKIFAVPDPI
jgi:hypothetical protein